MGNIDLLEDAAAKLAHTTRKMFGGHGLFASNGGMFAGVVDDDRIVLKFEDGSAENAAFKAVGGKPWVYQGKMGSSTMSSWLLVPDAMYDEPRELASWAARAYAVAPGKKAPKKAAPKKAAVPAPAKKAPVKAAAKKAPEKGGPKKAAARKSARKK